MQDSATTTPAFVLSPHKLLVSLVGMLLIQTILRIYNLSERQLLQGAVCTRENLCRYEVFPITPNEILLGTR